MKVRYITIDKSLVDGSVGTISMKQAYMCGRLVKSK